MPYSVVHDSPVVITPGTTTGFPFLVFDASTGQLVTPDAPPTAQVAVGSANVSITNPGTGQYEVHVEETGGVGNNFAVLVTACVSGQCVVTQVSYSVLASAINDVNLMVDEIVAKVLSRSLCTVEKDTDNFEGPHLHSLAAAIQRLTADQVIFKDSGGSLTQTIPGACEDSQPYGAVKLGADSCGTVVSSESTSECCD